MYVLVQPHELRQTWPYLKQGLNKILVKSPENWIPEDVYASAVSNKCNIWLAKEDNQVIGFVVGYINGEDFHVWCAYGDLGGNIKQWFSDLEDIARTQCKRITFDSWRPAWSRVAKELGFKPRSWAKEL
jgi:hypothetical protein